MQTFKFTFTKDPTIFSYFLFLFFDIFEDFHTHQMQN